MKGDIIYTSLCATWMILFATLMLFWLDAFLLHHIRHGPTVFCRFVQFIRPPDALSTIDPTPHEMILEKFHNISMIYESFIVGEPHFIDTGDRLLFLKNPENGMRLLGRTSDELVGRIQVVKNGTINEEFGCGWNMPIDKMNEKTAKSRIRSQFYILCPILVPNSNSFQHFLDGVLPKIAQIHELIKHPNVTVMLYRPWDRIIEEILKRIGIPDEKIFYYDQGYYTAQYLINTCITPPLHPQLWERGRTLLNIETSAKTFGDMVILLTRNMNRNPGRNMVNTDEVERFLKNRYQQKYHLFKGGYNLQRSIDLFQNARIVIGVHGGAFYNVMFAPNNITVIEIMPTAPDGNVVPENLAHTIVWQMSKMMNQSYWRISEKPVTSMGDVRVNLAKLRKILDKLDLRLGPRKQNVANYPEYRTYL